MSFNEDSGGDILNIDYVSGYTIDAAYREAVECYVITVRKNTITSGYLAQYEAATVEALRQKLQEIIDQLAEMPTDAYKTIIVLGDYMDETKMLRIADGFKVTFKSECDLLEVGFPAPAVQMEILASIPWVLESENTY